MARLTREALRFCRDHGIPEVRLFDASGLRPIDFKEVMASEEKWAAYGVSDCFRGHNLRNRHNTCLMCDTKRVGYLLRTKMAGYLYVAKGACGNLMKLGFSNDPTNRIAIANYEKWGGFNDWRLVAYGWAEEAGRLESDFLAKFADTQVPLQWERNWWPSTTRESFRADIERAIEELVWLCDEPPEIPF